MTSRMARRSVLVGLALLAITASSAVAIDHKNLDENRPLRLEDAYPIASGEWALEGGAGFTRERRGANRGSFPLELLYGPYPNLQLGLGTTLSTDPREIDEQTKSGDLQLSSAGSTTSTRKLSRSRPSEPRSRSTCRRASTRPASTPS